MSWLKFLVGVYIAVGAAGLVTAANGGPSAEVLLLHGPDEPQVVLDRVESALIRCYRLPVRREARVPVVALRASDGSVSNALLESTLVYEKGPEAFAVALAPASLPQLNRVIAKDLKAVFLVPALAMRRGPESKSAITELELRRLEKDVVLLVGKYLGVEICPNLTCGMSVPRTEAELDEKGRNLCPPCQKRVQALTEARGLFVPFAVPEGLRSDSDSNRVSRSSAIVTNPPVGTVEADAK